MDLRRLIRVEAVSVAGWHYEPPFDLYDGTNEQVAALLEAPTDGSGYYGLIRASTDEVVGFCCFGAEARIDGQEEDPGVVDVGGGIHPDFLSRGLATFLFPLILEFAAEHCRPVTFRTVVAAFNQRSLRLCLAAGFAPHRTLVSRGRDFQELTLSAGA